MNTMFTSSVKPKFEPVKKNDSTLKGRRNIHVHFAAFTEAKHAEGNTKVISAVEWIDRMLTFSRNR